MTTITQSTDIPSNINTLERLNLWSALALKRLNPTLSVLELPNSFPQRVVEVTILQGDDGVWRAITRTSITLADDFQSDNSVKVWMKAQEFGNIVLPAGFKSN